MPRNLGEPLPEPQRRLYSPDGLDHSKEELDALAQDVVSTFGTATGARVLIWLRSFTIETPCDGEASDAKLRHMEGMRHLVKIIEAFCNYDYWRQP